MRILPRLGSYIRHPVFGVCRVVGLKINRSFVEGEREVSLDRRVVIRDRAGALERELVWAFSAAKCSKEPKPAWAKMDDMLLRLRMAEERRLRAGVVHSPKQLSKRINRRGHR